MSCCWLPGAVVSQKSALGLIILSCRPFNTSGHKWWKHLFCSYLWDGYLVNWEAKLQLCCVFYHITPSTCWMPLCMKLEALNAVKFESRLLIYVYTYRKLSQIWRWALFCETTVSVYSGNVQDFRVIIHAICHSYVTLLCIIDYAPTTTISVTHRVSLVSSAHNCNIVMSCNATTWWAEGGGAYGWLTLQRVVTYM